jgi:hypothetical protein
MMKIPANNVTMGRTPPRSARAHPDPLFEARQANEGGQDK